MPDSAIAETAGLLATGPDHEPHPVPLEGVKVEARLLDFCSRVTVSQRFRNREKKPLEVVYVFPLEEGAAVCGFEAWIGARHVVAEVEEREKAFARYDDALADGHGAYLLEEERPDVFTASLGNLEPGAEVLLRVSYVAELPRDGDDLRFTLPTTVSPRYAPAEDREGVSPTPAEAVNPPRAFAVPYGLELDLELEMASPIRAVESPSHPLRLEIDGRRARVGLGERTTALDRDLVVKVRTADPAQPRVWLERSPLGHAVLLALEPDLPETRRPCEVVFVVDRSGSMQGSSIEEARNALQLCLRSLLPGSLFNLVGFGSSHRALFSESRPYDDASLAEASRWVATMDADMGGTEILAPLERVLEPPPHPELPRQVFLLTDGQVSNDDAVIALAGRCADRARVFSFGIGAGAGLHLVRGVARASGGAAELIAPGERIEGKVLRQLGRALAPALDEVSIDWGRLRVRQAPHRLPPVFGGDRLLVYGLLEGEPAEAELTLGARGPLGRYEQRLVLDPAAARQDSLLSTLAARRLIRDLEEGSSALHDRRGSLRRGGREDRIRKEIVDVARRYGIASRETSFVGVEERERPTGEPAELRRVPLALTRGWGGVDQSYAAASAVLMEAPPAPAARPAASSRSRLSRLTGHAVASRRRAVGPEAAPARRPMDRLIALQLADGSWSLDPPLAEALGVELEALEADLPRAEGGDALARRAWATALALVWLERHAVQERQEWQLLADKARDWLARCAARPLRSDWLALAAER